MPGLFECCKKFFGTDNLYEVLKISKNATDKEVKKAYHKLSLLVHPDRVEESQKEEATEKFKVLGHIHKILSDREKRATYDDTGCVDEDDDGFTKFNDLESWSEYWRSLFKEITIEDINNYEKEYKGSEMEIYDLKKAYVNSKGDMDFILEAVPFTNTYEEPRLREIVQKLVDAEEVEYYENFFNEPDSKREKRKRKYEKEAKEAEKLEKRLSAGKAKRSSSGELDLFQAIRGRQNARAAQQDSFLDRLAAKYASPDSDSGKKKAGRKAK